MRWGIEKLARLECHLTLSKEEISIAIKVGVEVSPCPRRPLLDAAAPRHGTPPRFKRLARPETDPQSFLAETFNTALISLLVVRALRLAALSSPLRIGPRSRRLAPLAPSIYGSLTPRTLRNSAAHASAQYGAIVKHPNGLGGIPFLFPGQYTNLSGDWYSDIGAALTRTMILKAWLPHVIKLVAFAVGRVTAALKKKKAANREELVALLRRPEFRLADRYGQARVRWYPVSRRSAQRPSRRPAAVRPADEELLQSFDIVQCRRSHARPSLFPAQLLSNLITDAVTAVRHAHLLRGPPRADSLLRCVLRPGRGGGPLQPRLRHPQGAPVPALSPRVAPLAPGSLVRAAPDTCCVDIADVCL